MKKFLFIHDIDFAVLTRDLTAYQNNVTNWVHCFKDWQNTTRTAKWTDITPEQCQDYELVMLLLISEQNPMKIAKFLEIMNHPGRKYRTIIYVDGVVGWQMNPFAMENKLGYLDIVSSADYIFHYGLPESEGYWRAIARDGETTNIDRPHPVDTAKNIHEVDLPWAVDFVKQYKFEDKPGLIFVGKSIKNINEERNAFSSWFVASALQAKTGWTIITFANNMLAEADRKKYYGKMFGIKQVIEIPALDWRTYIKVLSMARIGIHLDCLETRGQVALDCACLKIPLICSGSVAGSRLYPDTWLPHCRNLDNAIWLGKKLVDDKAFYDKVADYAYAKVEDYNLDVIGKRMAEITGVEL